jgi:hypothetical protein
MDRARSHQVAKESGGVVDVDRRWRRKSSRGLVWCSESAGGEIYGRGAGGGRRLFRVASWSAGLLGWVSEGVAVQGAMHVILAAGVVLSQRL